MKRALILVTLSWVIVGCEVLRPRTDLEIAPPIMPTAQVIQVQPAEITAANAKTKVKQLQEELDRDLETINSDPF